MQINTGEMVGSGFCGSVYSCKYGDKPAILKMEKYISSERRFERQIQFDEFARQHPDRFLTLEVAMIINDCQYKGFKPDISNVSEQSKERAALLLASKQCMVLIYTPVLTATLKEVKSQLSDEQRKAIYLHLHKSISLMHAAGWRYNDVHKGNIMCRDWRDPASYMLIDYGDVIYVGQPRGLSPSVKLTAADRAQIAAADDHAGLISAMVNKHELLETYEKKTTTPWKTVVKKCRKFYKKGADVRVTLDMYVNRYTEYLAIMGCTPATIAKAKQDPLAAWFYSHL